MIVKRDLEKTLKRYMKFPVVVILGPRQSGKTTVAQKFFKKHQYVNLENPKMLAYVTEDPERFLREYENKYGIIIDEFQYMPKLLSYIQIEADTHDRPGYFVLTGSQNFLMNQAITQSLAGRAGILHLLPLSIHELQVNKLLPSTVDSLIFKGGYPRIHASRVAPRDLFLSYINTYVERDVRLLVNLDNLLIFQKFIQLCAARVGQELNISDLATQCNINQKTVHEWLSLLDASYIIFFLRPYFNNFTKRLTKKPKLYFYDTGLACSFLGIRSVDELTISSFRGALFENLIIADIRKQYFNLGFAPTLYFWRDQNGRIELDGLIDLGTRLVPLEIKSGETINNDFFVGIKNWSKVANVAPESAYIIYGGKSNQSRSTGTVITWRDAGGLVAKLEEK